MSASESSCRIWIVAREYAGIAEAGGVKNVACSLCTELAKSTGTAAFIPQYGCTSLSELDGYEPLPEAAADIAVGDTVYRVSYAQAYHGNVKIVFVIAPCFMEKKGVYTYTAEEEAADSTHRRGTGHADFQLMNVLFQRAVLAFGRAAGIRPSVVHCQDAAAALVPFLARTDPQYADWYRGTGFAVTIHNAGPGYHHAFDNAGQAAWLLQLPPHLLEPGLCNGKVEPFLLASRFAALTTVSPWYAAELTDAGNPYTDGLAAAFSSQGCAITGITNGIDFEKYDPRDTQKSLLSDTFDPLTGDLAGKIRLRNAFASSFSKPAEKSGTPGDIAQFGYLQPDARAVYFSYHGRIVWQKGLDVFAGAAEKVLAANPDARFVVTGQGQPDLEAHQIALAEKYPGRYLFLRGYERAFVRSCVAMSDFLVLPSFFEPCGLEDLIGQVFGTVPVAHATGGLNKIENGKTGFLFDENTPEALSSLLIELCVSYTEKRESFLPVVMQGARNVQQTYSWEAVVRDHYMPLYRSVAAQNATKTGGPHSGSRNEE